MLAKGEEVLGTLGQETITVRPLAEAERESLAREVSENAVRAVIYAVILAMVVLVAARADQTGGGVFFAIMAIPLTVAVVIKLVALYWFFRDRQAGYVIVLSSAIGRTERLAASGRRWEGRA